MSKFHGKVGFVQTVETAPGVWTPKEIERSYGGDITRLQKRWDNSNQVNNNITLSMEVSIIADPFAYKNVGYIRYVEYMGSKWKVDNVTYALPRLNLTLGGIYNGCED